MQQLQINIRIGQKKFQKTISLNYRKLSTLCYAHAAPRQPEQLPDYTLMYEHIGRLAILHISNVTFICTRERRKRNVAISGFPGLKKDLRVTVSLKP